MAAVAVAGLGLIVMARTGDSQPDLQASERSEDADVVAGDDGATGDGLTPSAGGASDPLAALGERSVRLLDYAEVAATPDLCAEGVGEDVAETLGSIELSEGSSEVLDEAFVSHLNLRAVEYGDVSGDGVEEAVLHTVCDYGASGRQHEVQVWDASGGVAEPVGTVPAPPEELTGRTLPDINEIAVADGSLEVVWAVFAEGDPNCCPSDELRLSYELIDEEIVERG